MFKSKDNDKLLRATLIDKIGSQIYYGPFSGLKIPELLTSNLTISEILGLYESCLYSTWEKLISKNTKNIMLIGGNHGYYSAGLAYLYRPHNLYVFETEQSMHPLILEWFSGTDIGKPVLLNTATPEIFSNWDENVDLILCDCEGAELELLSPNQFSWQQKANIVVELHPFYKKNLLGEMIERFRESHHINIIYDDFKEDEKIAAILDGLGLKKLKYNKHPEHRWINDGNKKTYTSGIFLYMEVK